MYVIKYKHEKLGSTAAAIVDGRPSMLVFDRTRDETAPAYFVTLDWKDGRIVAIRDFLFAR